MSDYPAGYRQWPADDNDSSQAKQKYRSLKRKLRCLLYEQECFQEELRRLQRKLLRVNRDKSFLLDRLLQYEPPEFSSSDEEDTASSADEGQHMKSYWNSQVGGNHLDAMPAKKPSNFMNVTPGTAVQETKAQVKSKKSTDNMERIRCKQIENGKQCPKMVSRRVKAGLCLAHRGGDVKQGKTSKAASQSRPTTIVQPRSTVDYFNKPNPMISGISNDHLAASTSGVIQDEIYAMSNMHPDSATADSPASSDFHSNIYEGDDDLVIDLPE